MADDQDPSSKTEEPTSKRLDDAKRKGQQSHSQEINHWMLLGASALVMGVLLPRDGKLLVERFAAFLQHVHEINLTPEQASSIFTWVLTGLLGNMSVIFVLLLVAAVLGPLIQHPILIAYDRIMPKLSNLSPANGLRRIFGWRGVTEFVKGLAKLVLVGSIGFYLVWPRRTELAATIDAGPLGSMLLSRSLILTILTGILSALAAIAAADFLFQRWEHMRNLRMSRQDVKDEARQLDGDPLIKSRIRNIRMERARKRTMAAIPQADVIITNPTHFAVALAYDEKIMAAPKVIAKGQDLIALAIKKLAETHSIPTVENKALARALYAACDVDDEIPVTHYKAVAEIIGYVMRLKAGRRRS